MSPSEDLTLVERRSPFGSPEEIQLYFAAIVESSEDAIISKDLNGIVTSWNPSATRIFGYTAEEMIGQPIRILAAPDRIDEMPKILDRIRRGERIRHYETKRRAKSGQILDISLSVSPIRDAEGRIIGASKIARDITEKKAAERALIEQAERLAQSNADLQQFAYVTSHDLQEPLRMIASFSQLLHRKYSGRLDKQADEYIDHVVTSATRLSDMIRDILTYSRVASAHTASVPEVPTEMIVEWAIDNLEGLIAETGAIIEIGHLPTVSADKVALSQVFQNLLSNAIKYRRDGTPPHIRIQAQTNEGEYVFSVIDNGIGIPAEYHKEIFGLFKRLHSTRCEGTGIGLALCKRIVEKHRGRMWVESEPGKGSTFFFSLPRPDANDHQSENRHL